MTDFGTDEAVKTQSGQEPSIREVDALLVGDFDSMCLWDWMRQSGFADLLPSLRPKVAYVGVSGGSMAVTPSLGESYRARHARVSRWAVDFSCLPTWTIPHTGQLAV